MQRAVADGIAGPAATGYIWMQPVAADLRVFRRGFGELMGQRKAAATGYIWM